MTETKRHPHPTVPCAFALLAFAFAGPAVAGEPTVAALGAEGDSTATVTASAPLDAGPRYPRAVIARPLTLPAGIAMVGADASSDHDLGAMGGAPIVGFGITDELDVQAAYAFATRELEVRGALDADVGYAVIRGALGGKLEASARVRGGYDLLGSTARPLMIGLHVQYNVTPWLAVISGAPGAQQLRISLADDAELARPIDLGLPLGIGVQPTGELYVQLDTRLGQLDLGESANAVIGRDATPLTLTAVYNVVPALDVQAAIGTDLSASPGDSMSFLVGARLYAGER